MTGTGSPGGTEQLAARLSDFLGFADVVAMGAHYRRDDGKVSRLGRGQTPRLNGGESRTGAPRGSDPFHCSWPRGVWETVGRGEVGLDVEQRRAVDAVDFAHGECHPLDTNKLHGGKRDRVGPHRRAQRKGAAGMTQMCRRLLDKVAPSLV